MHLSMVCRIPGADVGERRGNYCRNFPQGVGTQSGLSQSTEIAYTFSIVLLNVFGKFFVNSTDTHISFSHTVHNRKI